MRIDAISAALEFSSAARACRGGVFASTLEQAALDDPDSSHLDFTSMTRSDLLDWVNGEIRAGRLDLDDTSPFVGLTLRIDASGPDAIDDTECVDFMQIARDGIADAIWRRDEPARAALSSALAIMRQYQGRLADS